MKTNCIILFIKAPKPGFVKTRLAKDLGYNEACRFYKKFTEKIIQEIKKTEFNMEIHFYPKNEINLIRSWLGSGYKFYPQQGENIGEKMKNAIFNTLDKGYDKVILTGSDIPDLSKEIFEEGFKNINNSPVLGPSEDGGYYLIGVDKKTYNGLYFENISWSTEKVLKETVSRMVENGTSPYLLPVLNDIDTIRDLKHFEETNNVNFSNSSCT